MRKLLEPRADGEGELAAELQTELVEDRVYLLTPKGEVFDLPHGATVLDFAYHVHTEVGHRCRGAKVNGRIVPLTYQPHSGDRVEILTAKVGEPSRDWLSPHHGYLHSSRAKDKVRAWFRRIAHDANLAAGRAMLERELRRLAMLNADLSGLPAQFHLQTHDELLIALALGEVNPGQISRLLQEAANPPEPEPRRCRRGACADGRPQRVEHRGRRQPAHRAGALLPAAAGRSGARFRHPRARRVGASCRLPLAGAAGAPRSRAGDRGELGAASPRRPTRWTSSCTATTARVCRRTSPR